MQLHEETLLSAGWPKTGRHGEEHPPASWAQVQTWTTPATGSSRRQLRQGQVGLHSWEAPESTRDRCPSAPGALGNTPSLFTEKAEDGQRRKSISRQHLRPGVMSSLDVSVTSKREKCIRAQSVEQPLQRHWKAKAQSAHSRCIQRTKQVAAAGEEALPTDVLPAQVAPHGGQACVERVRTPTKKWMHRTMKLRRVPKAGHEQPKSLSKRWEASQRLTDCLHTTVATSCRRCHPQYEELQQLASAVAGQWTAHEPHTLSLGMRRGTC